jgi:SAM-dependent methyltransferase
MPRARHLLRGVRNGIRLGLLDDEGLRALDEHRHATDHFPTREWNERGLMDWERAAVDQLFTPGERVLVVACGGGREVLALLRDGYDAHGCESHPELCAFAEDLLAGHGHPGRIEPAPRDEVPPGPPCDGVILGWGVYSLVAPAARRVAFLAAARARLRAGGRLLLSGFGTEAPGRELMLTARLATALRRVRRREAIEVGETLAPNRIRVFTRAEMESEAQAAGLQLTGWQLLAVADSATHYAVAALSAP